ncbi:MAG TPA: hypothetical protein VG317_07260 [Pseudonocardiaceae bacterium]|jgi:hypothetical protein|nr:hypothetical protein [Pseudonocardiaceae bacterium]
MSSPAEADEESTTDSTELLVQLAELAEDAEYFRPRLFAIYGVRRQQKIDDQPARPFLGWGIDFRDELGARFWGPGGSAHHSESAEQVLMFYRRLGEAHLRWLD